MFRAFSFGLGNARLGFGLKALTARLGTFTRRNVSYG